MPDATDAIDEDAAFPRPPDPLTAARAQLAAVTEELDEIRSFFGRTQEQGGYDGTDASLSSATAGFDAEAEKVMRHLEIDRDAANSRSRRLEEENQSLVAALARMEGQLRAAKEREDDSQRRQQHIDLHLRRNGAGELAGSSALVPPKAALPATAAAGKAVGDVTSLGCGKLNHAAQIGLKAHGASQDPTSLNRKQLLAYLSQSHADVQQEQKRREKVERRVAKDQERLEQLLALAEWQRDEISRLRIGVSTQAVTGGHKFAGVQNGKMDMNWQPTQTGQLQKQPALTRQESAPTKLPSVTQAMNASG